MRQSTACWTAAATSWGRKWRRSSRVRRISRRRARYRRRQRDGRPAAGAAGLRRRTGRRSADRLSYRGRDGGGGGTHGAVPVLVDIDPATFTIDCDALEDAVRRDWGVPLKAIVAVHLYGHPADMPAVMDIAGRHGLRVIEDARRRTGHRWAETKRAPGDTRRHSVSIPRRTSARWAMAARS